MFLICDLIIYCILFYALCYLTNLFDNKFPQFRVKYPYLARTLRYVFVFFIFGYFAYLGFTYGG